MCKNEELVTFWENIDEQPEPIKIKADNIEASGYGK